MRSVYLDYNATAPMHPSVIEVMMEGMRQSVNVSSPYQLGQKARQKTQLAQRFIAEQLGCDRDHVIFTSGGTESNNTVLKGISWDRIIISEVEHPSVARSALSALLVPMTQRGVVDLEALEGLLAVGNEGRTLVSIQWANNETGVIQPIAEIASLCRKYGSFFHSDGVQALGKIPVSFQGMDLDFLSLSLHKIGGPQGMGLLILKPGVPFKPFITGGPQQHERRAGTTSFSGILGGADALRLMDLDQMALLREHHNLLEAHIKNVWPSARVIGEDAPRLPNTTLVVLPGIPNTTTIMNFDLGGISVGGGSACSSGSLKASDTMKAMGLTDDDAGCVIRMSSGWATLADDFEAVKKVFDARILPLLDSKYQTNLPVSAFERGAE